jgi:succinate dehydrogenase flavin-adding protein (antitoxin of CptAB toxin-antitoxin module)
MSADVRRMLWRCRRGLLELDLLLESFVRQHYETLTPAQLQAFDRLLDFPDNELWDVVTGKAHNDDASLQPVLSLLRQVNISQGV